MPKASRCLFLSIFLVSLAHANDFKIPAESEALYFQALPALNRIDSLENDFVDSLNRLPPNGALPVQKKEQFRDVLQTEMKDALPLLNRSAEEGNPAAQYRLAWILSDIQPREQVSARVCTLLRSSLSHGFTPAGLTMLNYCLEEIDTPEFRALMDTLPEQADLYAKYFPQPTFAVSCDLDRHAARTFSVPLDEKAAMATLFLGFAYTRSVQSHERTKSTISIKRSSTDVPRP